VWRRVPPVRWAALAVAVAAVGLGQVGSGPGPGPWVAFLDVGQGDAAVVRGSGGETILVDGGPDPVALARTLDRYRVDRVDLLVVSHRHADHVTGLSAVLGRVPVGEVCSLGPLLDAVDSAGVPRRTPGPGSSAVLGSVRLEVLGPVRRYASPNDESLVIRVALGGMSVLFAGDIETFAQADLGPVRSDVLKVPHQGAATSDLDWIRASAGSVSVISVGPNDYGHPSSSVIEALGSAGSLVCRTDLGGDVVVRPGERGPEVARRCPVVHSPP
jgi:competence protein ComEC